jgi:hypothetical protein
MFGSGTGELTNATHQFSANQKQTITKGNQIQINKYIEMKNIL